MATESLFDPLFGRHLAATEYFGTQGGSGDSDKASMLVEYPLGSEFFEASTQHGAEGGSGGVKDVDMVDVEHLTAKEVALHDLHRNLNQAMVNLAVYGDVGAVREVVVTAHSTVEEAVKGVLRRSSRNAPHATHATPFQ